MKKRRTLKIKSDRDVIERTELNKLINKKQREDKRKNNMNMIERTIREGKSLKQTQGKLVFGKKRSNITNE